MESSQNKKDGPKYPNLVPYIVFVCFLNVLFIAFCFWSFHSVSNYKRDFHVDASLFEHSVSNAVFTFLGVLSGAGTNQAVSSSSSSSPSLSPALKRVPGLGFAHSPRYGNYFVLDGCSFREGDYCDFGLVISVGDDRAFCNGVDGLVIIRSVPSDVKNDWFASGRGSRDSDRTMSLSGAKNSPDNASPGGSRDFGDGMSAF